MQRVTALLLIWALLLAVNPAAAAQQSTIETGPGASITIYNSDFAVVREKLPLNLHAGVNDILFAGATSHVEPDSVILRDPEGRTQLQILEQGYRNDPVSQQRLLSLFEGQTIDFERMLGDGKTEIVKGKIIRSGYSPSYYNAQGYYQPVAGSDPLIEVDGKLSFGLPGKPLFPSLGEDSVLKPTLDWRLRSDKSGPLNAQLSYISSGMDWHADYNLIASPSGDSIDLVGWVTFRNNTGKTFRDAHVRLMAGDVNKLEPYTTTRDRVMRAEAMAVNAAAPPVSEKAFDEFHLYTLNDPVTLRDGESKQVEFVRAQNVKSQRLYVYDGLQMPNYGWYEEAYRTSPDYGTQMNKKVWVMQEFKNSKANNLGMPLPKGRLRFYGENKDAGDLEFTGENTIDHTPADETVRVYTGNAFDIVGERRRTNFKSGTGYADESFEIKVRNHKKTPVEVRVVEHLYRWSTWDLTAKSQEFRKIDSRTIEFRVPLAPDAEKVVTYSVHYSWM